MQKIQGSVGRAAVNAPDDVRLIQHLLNQWRVSYARSARIEESGRADDETIRRIRSFQSLVVGMRHPDGKVDPDGRTFHALVEGSATRLESSLGLSEKGRALLQSIETQALKPYDDQTGKVIDHWVKGATIGYGHLIRQDEWEGYSSGITAQQAQTLFEEDLKPFVEAVAASVTVVLRRNQFDALVILAYNIGIANFKASSVLKLVNDPDAQTAYPSLQQAWLAWNKSQGRINPGLEHRRQAEWKIYAEGIYARW
jgi:GH24 family phage-related lysozyme (muramidase)